MSVDTQVLPSGRWQVDIADAYGGERFGLALETVVDRDRFGFSWNNPLPSGEPALANEATITAELQLAKQA